MDLPREPGHCSCPGAVFRYSLGRPHPWRRNRRPPIPPRFASTTRCSAGLIRNNPLAIAVLDAEQRVQLINPAFETMFGYREAEVAGQQIHALLVPDEIRDESDRISRQALGGQIDRATTHRRRKDGTLVDVEVTFVPFTNISDRPDGAYAIYRDLSQQRKAERHLRAQYAVIEALANSSTIENAAEWVLRAVGRIGRVAGRRDVARRQDVQSDALRRVLVPLRDRRHGLRAADARQRVPARRGPGPHVGAEHADVDRRRHEGAEVFAPRDRARCRTPRGLQLPDGPRRRRRRRRRILHVERARARSADAADVRRPRAAARRVRGPDARAGAAGALLHDVGRPALHRDLRRLLHARQRLVAPHSRLHLDRADGAPVHRF